MALAGCKWTGFDDPANPPVVTKATDWLKTQQQADGSFEVAGFPGFETSDAVVALGEKAQTTNKWNAAKALAAVNATKTGGKSALDALDDFADGTLNAGQAAKLIVLVTQPLGLSPTAFDPQGDGARNLVSVVDAGVQSNGSYGAFNATLYAALAKRLDSGAVPAKTVTLIRAPKKPPAVGTTRVIPPGTTPTSTPRRSRFRRWSPPRSARPTRTSTTGCGTSPRNRPAAARGSRSAATTRTRPSTAIFAVTAAGFDANSPCWRNTVSPGLSGNPYGNPVNWLRSQQAADGHITSANDAFPPVNTFATTQTVQALERGWLPVAWLDARVC